MEKTNALWNGEDAEGFTRIYGMQALLAHRARTKNPPGMKTRIALLHGASYVGGELIRLLLRPPGGFADHRDQPYLCR